MTLRFLFPILALFALAVAAFSAEEAAERIKNKVIETEQHLADALAANDVDAIDSLLSRAWKTVGSDGSVTSRDRFIRALKGGKLKFDEVKISKLDVRVFGQMAVVIGVSEASGESDGEPFSSRDRFTDVFILIEGAWKCATSHASEIPDGGEE